MESISTLPDPKNDRQVKSVKPPPNKPMPTSLLFPSLDYPSKHILFNIKNHSSVS
jgi:hypothetical protein